MKKVWAVSYWTWMAVLAAAFYAFPEQHMIIWSTLGASSAVAVVIGVVRNRPRKVWPWVLLAVGLLCFAAGDTTYNLLTSVGHERDPFPSVADIFYLVTCVSLVAGMFGLVRAGAAIRDRSAILDSLVLTSGVGLIYWIFLISPDVHRSDMSVLEKIISIAYPLSDVLLLALVARLLVASRRAPAVVLLAIGTAGLLIADVLYGLIQLHADWMVGGPVDFGWIVLYATWGGAALHPSMAALTEPRTARPSEVGPTRLIALAASALAAPVALLIESVNGGNAADAPVIAVLSALVFLLVMVRLSDALTIHRRALNRERALRHAGDALVSATNFAEVRKSIEAAIAKMLPSGAEHRVELVGMDTRWGGHVPSPSSPGDGSWAAEMRYVWSLHPAMASRLRGFDVALVCSLPQPNRPIGDQHPGALVVAAPEGVLSVMKGPVEVLTSQAALALDRISLTDEVNRRKSEEYFRTLVQNTADVILIVDDDTMIRYASPSARSIFGDQIVVGASLDTLLVSEDHSLSARSIESYAKNTDWSVRRVDTARVQVEASAQDLSSDPTVRGFVVTLRDVTERRRLERELTHHAFHDSLTGLANRLLFQDRVRKAVARASRNDTVAGVLFIDLDDFKVVNDTMGHHAGDQLLVAVADRLAEVLRPQDSAARLGGDEFAALIENVDDPMAVEDVAAQILSVLSDPFVVNDALVSGAASVGVATTVEAGSEPDLLRQADLALYVAKGAGKGQWRRYQSALHTAVLKRMQVRTELDQAVKEDAFELLYQPIVELADGRPVGYEALLRWNHPQQGMVAPIDFIEVAEESGLIVPIGDWVLQTAIDSAVAWDDMSYVSVNVSARQFRTPGFVAKIRSRLAESGLNPTRLMLEITESLLLPDEEQVWADLHELRTLGVQIAIDDFGTGYSSLSYLRRVPADVVKVDKSFVETIGSSGQQRALVEGIVWLAATLGLQVIAEGIETEDDRRLLQDLGCPMGQGYLFSPPVKQDRSLAWRVDAASAAASVPAIASPTQKANGFHDTRSLPHRAASL